MTLNLFTLQHISSFPQLAFLSITGYLG